MKATDADRALSSCGLALIPSRDTPALTYASTMTCFTHRAIDDREISFLCASRTDKKRPLWEVLMEDVRLRYSLKERTGQRDRSSSSGHRMLVKGLMNILGRVLLASDSLQGNLEGN